MDFFSFEKTLLQPAAIHDPNLNLALIQICNSICEESTKKDGEKKKTFAGEFLWIFQTFEQKACLHEMYPTFLSDKTS